MSAPVSAGFAFDRWWMVVNDKGRMLTQRQAPKLALVETALPPEAIEEGAWKPLPPDAALSEEFSLTLPILFTLVFASLHHPAVRRRTFLANGLSSSIY